ncbi:hypothetical protein C8R43DRAFT_241671 [Mycena crocata]|nr:hypothetical protein C8R43DRAFT_241671 [Mycena crocata]
MDPATIIILTSSVFGIVKTSYEVAHRNGSTKRLDAGAQHLQKGIAIMHAAWPAGSAAREFPELYDLLVQQQAEYNQLKARNPWSPVTFVKAHSFHNKCWDSEQQALRTSVPKELLNLQQRNAGRSDPKSKVMWSLDRVYQKLRHRSQQPSKNSNAGPSEETLTITSASATFFEFNSDEEKAAGEAPSSETPWSEEEASYDQPKRLPVLDDSAPSFERTSEGVQSTPPTQISTGDHTRVTNPTAEDTDTTASSCIDSESGSPGPSVPLEAVGDDKTGDAASDAKNDEDLIAVASPGNS